MVDFADKLAYFQAITGLDDTDLCTEILGAHGWDLERAVAAFTSPGLDHSDFPSLSSGSTAGDVGVSGQSHSRPIVTAPHSVPSPPGIAWKLIKLPVSVISGSLGLISGAVGFGLWAAGGVFSYTLGVIGLVGGRTGDESSSPSVSVSAAASESINFVSGFRRDFGGTMPNFVCEGFMDALQRSRRDFKLLFVYLHSPDHPDTPYFCERTLCSDVVVSFVNENFVPWGGSIRGSEGFKMSNTLKASRFPFCAVVMASTNQRIALLQQVEGPKSPEELLIILQKVLEESSPTLVTARVEFEERRNNIRLREEQDAAFQAALEADQARELQRREENERLENEAAEAERKRKEEEEAQKRAELEAFEKIAALARTRHQKFLSLGSEPEKGPDVTQVVVRFPNGLRKERRFISSTAIEKLYDFVDSLDCLEMQSYSLVSNFPRVVYGSQMLTKSLKEAGLHPQASLFVEPN